ncbi:PAP/fibrillin family protein [Sandaracinobacteroides saxicola]|uniref:Fibrillin n=1 Tax=Sandaracinobacteroides saxicola TaxID=2759707 RepID=A0A7G5ILA2_9SPHN|nr:PAP/fibrillin family protein [Sandaracinobacteroides saxicola]QMW24144.1 fibrillin [Sandaracinobacteroides saxicola]
MPEISALKVELAELGARTEVGFDAGGADVERIKALAAALEGLNPTAEPSRAVALLRGRWKLLYSSFGLQRDTTLARLSFNVLPKSPIRVKELFQEIDPATGLYDNVVTFDGEDGFPGESVTLGEYAVVDDHRLDVRFTEALVLGPGAPVRLPLDNARIPPLYSDVTFLDDGFRLNRGSFGNLYVLERLDPAPLRWARDG